MCGGCQPLAKLAELLDSVEDRPTLLLGLDRRHELHHGIGVVDDRVGTRLGRRGHSRQAIPYVGSDRVRLGNGGAGLCDALDLSRHANVEVMTHPSWSRDRELLLSDDWLHTLKDLPLRVFPSGSSPQGLPLRDFPSGTSSL